MTTLLYPPVPESELPSLIHNAAQRELEWYLNHTHSTTLPTLKSGLTEIDALLSPSSGAHTLVLSSLRSESIKGTVTRLGTRIIKGDVALKLSSTPPPKGRDSHRLCINQSPDAPVLVLSQLIKARDLIARALDIVDVSLFTGSKTDASFVRGQLELLCDTVSECNRALKGSGSVTAIESGVSRPTTPGGGESGPSRPRSPMVVTSRPHTPAVPSRKSTPQPPSQLQPQQPQTHEAPTAPGETAWHLSPHDPATFSPALPANINAHLTIADAALVLQVRALESAHAPPSDASITGLGIRERLGLAARPQTHEEAGQIFSYSDEEVRVREKLRVASQDPSLLAAMAKLGALGHSVAMSRCALDAVMGVDRRE